MTKTVAEQYWGHHIEAVKTQAITAKAYAQRHGLVLSALYYWQRRLKLTAASRVSPPPTLPTPATPQASKFVSLRIQAQTPEHPLRPAAANCTLVLGVGVRLEMTALPEPQWLVALARCAHGVH